MGKYSVDLNSDLGESFGAYTIGMDADVLSFVSSANIACGFHAGDPAVMRKTVALAKERGVSMGAHPGYPDLVGFGRRNMNVSASDMHDYVLYQLGALAAFTRAAGTELIHVKPHGAMYNMAAKDASLAAAVCRAVKEFNASLILLGLANSRFADAAADAGIRFASEVLRTGIYGRRFARPPHAAGRNDNRRGRGGKPRYKNDKNRLCNGRIRQGDTRARGFRMRTRGRGKGIELY